MVEIQKLASSGKCLEVPVIRGVLRYLLQILALASLTTNRKHSMR